MSAIGAADLAAAMAAYIVKSAHGAVVIADDKDRRSAHGERQKIPGGGNLERESREQPARMPDVAHLGRMQRRIVIERARHAVALAPRGEESFELRTDGCVRVWHDRLQRIAQLTIRRGSPCARDRTTDARDALRDGVLPSPRSRTRNGPARRH